MSSGIYLFLPGKTVEVITLILNNPAPHKFKLDRVDDEYSSPNKIENKIEDTKAEVTPLNPIDSNIDNDEVTPPSNSISDLVSTKRALDYGPAAENVCPSDNKIECSMPDHEYLVCNSDDTTDMIIPKYFFICASEGVVQAENQSRKRISFIDDKPNLEDSEDEEEYRPKNKHRKQPKLDATDLTSLCYEEHSYNRKRKDYIPVTMYTSTCCVCADWSKNESQYSKVMCQTCSKIFHKTCGGYRKTLAKSYSCPSCAINEVSLMFLYGKKMLILAF